jgi:hypothetical protein
LAHTLTTPAPSIGLQVTLVPPEPGRDACGHALFASNHAFNDGMGNVLFAAEFMAAAARNVEASPGPALCTLLPSMSTLLLGPPDARKVLQLPAPEAVLEAMVAPMVEGMRTNTPQLPLHASIPRYNASLTLLSTLPHSPTLFVCAEGSKGRFAAARVAYKENKATLHGAYVAAVTAAWSRVLESMEGVPGKVSCFLGTPFNMRGARTPGLAADSIGNYVTVSAMRHTLAGVSLDTPFWQLARDAAKSTEEDVASDTTKFV